MGELVAGDFFGGEFREVPDEFSRGEVCGLAQSAFVESSADGGYGMNLKAFGELGFVSDEPAQASAQRVRQNMGKGGEQHAGVWMRSS